MELIDKTGKCQNIANILKKCSANKNRPHLKKWKNQRSAILSIPPYLKNDPILQKDYREITAADDIDRKVLAKMRKNAARDSDII